MPRSQAEVRLAHSVLSGNARDSGMGENYAEEVVSKMHGRKMSSLPNHTNKAKKGFGLKRLKGISYAKRR